MFSSIKRSLRKAFRIDAVNSAADATAPAFDMPPEEYEREVRKFRQGDVVDIPSLLIGTASRSSVCETPSGAVLLTQTCDAVLPTKPNVVLSPVAKLTGNSANEAASGRVLRYVPIPNLGPEYFADLHVIVTIPKVDFASFSRIQGINPEDDDQIRRFGQAIGRRFERFPFPDNVTPWLRPLEKTILKKHDRRSAEGAALKEVVELRIECAAGWSTNPPLALTLCVIVKPGVIPDDTFGEDLTLPPDNLQSWLRDQDGNLVRKSHEIAEKLAKAREESPSSSVTYWLWLALAEAWAAQCKPSLQDVPLERRDSVQAAVSDFDVDVVDESKFTLQRYRHSEQLDLDHLSPPTPL
jgi:hypothetical protein